MAKAKPVRLVVLGRERQLYGTRALTAGDEFEVDHELADILVLLGKARYAPEELPPLPKKREPKEQAKAQSLGELEPLRRK